VRGQFPLVDVRLSGDANGETVSRSDLSQHINTILHVLNTSSDHEVKTLSAVLNAHELSELRTGAVPKTGRRGAGQHPDHARSVSGVLELDRRHPHDWLKGVASKG